MSQTSRNLFKSNKIAKVQVETLSALEVNKKKDLSLDTIVRSLDMKIVKEECQSSSVNKIDLAPSQTYLARIAENKIPGKRFELRCSDFMCDDDNKSVISNGGYSTRCEVKKNEFALHNHRKLNHLTVYEYTEGDIPEVYEGLLKRSDLRNDQNKDQKSSEVLQLKPDWRLSNFAPIFFSKNSFGSNLQKDILREQLRQKLELQKYELSCQNALEEKNKAIQARKKQWKTNTALQSKKKDQMCKNQTNNQRHTKKIQNVQFSCRDPKIKTRQQQNDQQGFQQIYRGQPNHRNNYCYPCKTKYENYFTHIELTEHKLRLRQGIGSEYFKEEIDKLTTFKKDYLGSDEFAKLQDMADYLKNISGQINDMMMRNNNELKVRLKEIYYQVQKKWAQ